jgi:Flp pilus assembly protein TadG
MVFFFRGVAIMIGKIRDQKRARRGSTIVETAFVLNIVLLGMLGIFEYGRIVMYKQLMTNAAREGARLAVAGTASNPETTTQQITTTVNNFLAGQTLRNISIQVFQANPSTGANIGAWDQAPFGGAIAVKVEGDYIPLIPVSFGILSKSQPLHLTSTSMMLSEAN